jgi:hypothetical protein
VCLLVLLREFIQCPAQVTEDHGCGNRKAQSAFKKKTDLLLPLLLLHNSLSLSLSLSVSLSESLVPDNYSQSYSATNAGLAISITLHYRELEKHKFYSYKERLTQQELQ